MIKHRYETSSLITFRRELKAFLYHLSFVDHWDDSARYTGFIIPTLSHWRPVWALCDKVPLQRFCDSVTTIMYIFSERELMFMFAICRRPSVCLSSVVRNVRAPYSGDWNFRQCFYAIWYLGHLWPFGKNFTEIVLGEPLRRGVKPKRGRKM